MQHSSPLALCHLFGGGENHSLRSGETCGRPTQRQSTMISPPPLSSTTITHSTHSSTVVITTITLKLTKPLPVLCVICLVVVKTTVFWWQGPL
jgi:hypothetical protein